MFQGNQCPLTDCQGYESELPCPNNMRITSYFTHRGVQCPGCDVCGPDWQDSTQSTEQPPHPSPTGNTERRNQTRPGSEEAAGGDDAQDEIVVESLDLYMDEVVEEVVDDVTTNRTASRNHVNGSDLQQQQQQQQQEGSKSKAGNSSYSTSRDTSANRAINTSPPISTSTPKDRRSATPSSQPAHTQGPMRTSPRSLASIYGQRGSVILEGNVRMLHGVVRFLRRELGRSINIRVLSNNPW